ncbi:hypothetical protein [Sphingomonas radiodurans]|uniref:hypothetical protein n=1 Tax=Sphingomonas radiodurans TaxID=2890321 RepID=UPI001E45F1AE|nr:hypothetical protein [Sphingomonas radiodurans]WBH16777.1 hypothetical protein LLW23_01235 [Sphingomonas radiodurans]
MLFTTPTQWLALAVALIAGWLFGLASHPGGRKWKQRYVDERDVHGRNRKDFDGRIAERDARIKELERDNARLAAATPVAAPTPVVAATPVATTRVAHADHTARPVSTTRGRWFDWNNRAGTVR